MIAVFDMVSTPRCEVEACDTAPFIERMSAIVSNPRPHHAGAFVFMVDGYNDTPDEIYEIPAVRSYYRKLDQEWPYLLFFANTDLESLAVITWCLMDNIACAKAVGTQALTKYDIPELLRWLDSRLPHMGHLLQKAHGMTCSPEFSNHGKVMTPTDQAVLDRTKAIFQAYNLPFNEDPYKDFNFRATQPRSNSKMKTLKHPHLVVVGRIPDEENVIVAYTNLTLEQAVEAFEKKLIAEHIADYCETHEQKQEVKEQGVYVDAVFTSDTPIGIDWRC